jgi:hypothetical protein
MTTTTRCPYLAQARGILGRGHPDGLHRCMRTVPVGGDHAGEHTCACGVSFVVTSPPGSPLPASLHRPTHEATPGGSDPAGAATAGGEVHVIDLREDGWTIQHPLSCRARGELFSCPVNRLAGQQLLDPLDFTGRFEVGLNDDGDQLVIGDRVEDATP